MASEQEMIEKTREAGREFLRKTPSAFGGGIDPSTGVRKKKSKTVPSGFIGPLQPGVTREAPEPVFAGPVRPTTDVEKFRATGVSTTRTSAFQGPVRPTTDVKTFRETGKAVPQPQIQTLVSRTPQAVSFQGPVRPATDTQIFRETGRTVPLGVGVAQRMGAIEGTAETMPVSTRDVGEIPASVPDLQQIESSTGPDSINANTPLQLTIEPTGLNTAFGTQIEDVRAPVKAIIDIPGQPFIGPVQRTGAQPAAEPFDPEQFAMDKARDAERLTVREAVTTILRGETLPETAEAAKSVVRLEGGVGDVVAEFLAPLKSTGRRGGDIPINIPQFGTVTADAPSGVVQTTPFELEREAQVKTGTPFELAGLSQEARVTGSAGKAARDVGTKFQSKVDSGELSVEEAQVQAQAEFSEDISGIVSRERADQSGLQKRGGEAVVGATALAADIAAFELAGRLSPGRVARSIDRLSLKELAATKPSKFLGVLEKGADDAFLKLRGGRIAGSARQEVEISGKVFGLDDVDDLARATFRGRGKTTTELDSFVKRIQGFKGEEAKITAVEEFGVVTRAKGEKAIGELVTGSGVEEIKASTSRGFSDILPEKLTTKEFGVRSIVDTRERKFIPRLADLDSQFAPRRDIIIPKSKTVKLQGRKTSRFIGVAEDTSKGFLEFAGGQPKKVRVSIPSAKPSTLADIDAIGRIKQVQRIKEPLLVLSPKQVAKKVTKDILKDIGIKVKPGTRIPKLSRVSRKGVSEFEGAGRILRDLEVPAVPTQVTRRVTKLKKVSRRASLDLDSAIKAVVPGVATAGKSALKVRTLIKQKPFMEFSAAATGALVKKSRGKVSPPKLKTQQPLLKLDSRETQRLSQVLLPETTTVKRKVQRGRRKVARALSLDQAARQETGQLNKQVFRKPKVSKTKKITAFPNVFPFRDSFAFRRPTFPTKIKPRIGFGLDIQGATTRKKRKGRKGLEAEFFTPGFTEKILGIKKKITKKEAARIARSGDPFAQRAVPVFID